MILESPQREKALIETLNDLIRDSFNDNPDSNKIKILYSTLQRYDKKTEADLFISHHKEIAKSIISTKGHIDSFLKSKNPNYIIGIDTKLSHKKVKCEINFMKQGLKSIYNTKSNDLSIVLFQDLINSSYFFLSNYKKMFEESENIIKIPKYKERSKDYFDISNLISEKSIDQLEYKYGEVVFSKGLNALYSLHEKNPDDIRINQIIGITLIKYFNKLEMTNVSDEAKLEQGKLYKFKDDFSSVLLN